MKITWNFFNPKKGLIGFNYEVLSYMEGLDENKKPIIVDHHLFSIGIFIVSIDFLIRGAE